MSVKIYPSLLSADFAHLASEVKAWEKLDIDGLHLDVMDGHYVPNLTFGPDIVAALRRHTKVFFDVHLMIEAPEKYVERFVLAGANAISFHPSTTTNPVALIKQLKSRGVKVGLALNPNEACEVISPYLGAVDHVLLMTVSPGFAGGKFVPEALDKIAVLKEQGPKSLSVTVDGGVTNVTAKTVVQKGADALVSGSYLFKGGADFYGKNLKSLQQAFRQQVLK